MGRQGCSCRREDEGGKDGQQPSAVGAPLLDVTARCSMCCLRCQEYLAHGCINEPPRLQCRGDSRRVFRSIATCKRAGQVGDARGGGRPSECALQPLCSLPDPFRPRWPCTLRAPRVLLCAARHPRTRLARVLVTPSSAARTFGTGHSSTTVSMLLMERKLARKCGSVVVAVCAHCPVRVRSRESAPSPDRAWHAQ